MTCLQFQQRMLCTPYTNDRNFQCISRYVIVLHKMNIWDLWQEPVCAQITIAASKLVQTIRKGAQIVKLVKLYLPREWQQILRLWFLKLCRTRRGHLTTATLLAITRANTHTNPKRRNDESRPTSMLLRLHYLQSANNVGPILGTLHEILLWLFWMHSRIIWIQ
jgi:hypothetical protein